MNWSSTLKSVSCLKLSRMVEHLLLVILAATGWMISFYFYLVYKRRISEDVLWMPPLLRISGYRCAEIVDTDFGRTFGRSNAFWGLWYYAFLAVALVGNWELDFPAMVVLLIVALVALAYSLYLVWGLYQIRVVCRPCLGVHGVNLAIFLILLYRTWPLLAES